MNARVAASATEGKNSRLAKGRPGTTPRNKAAATRPVLMPSPTAKATHQKRGAQKPLKANSGDKNLRRDLRSQKAFDWPMQV